MMLRLPLRHLMRRPAPLCAVVAVAAVLAIVGGLVSAALAQDRPKLSPSAKPSDCRTCHARTSPLPKGHLPVANKTLSDCTACHGKGSPAALAGKLPLSHTHQLAGVTCKSCHDNVRKPQAAKADKCLTCHTGEAIFAATEQLEPRNPHGSPHYGKESDCNLCHHQHEKSENFCATCHSFVFKVP